MKKNAKSKFTVTLELDEAEAVFKALNAWLQEQDEPDRTAVNASRALERISRELDKHGTDRMFVAVLVALFMVIGMRQAYMAGVRKGRAEGPQAVAANLEVLRQSRLQAYQAGWNACMEQF